VGFEQAARPAKKGESNWPDESRSRYEFFGSHLDVYAFSDIYASKRRWKYSLAEGKGPAPVGCRKQCRVLVAFLIATSTAILSQTRSKQDLGTSRNHYNSNDDTPDGTMAHHLRHRHRGGDNPAGPVRLYHIRVYPNVYFLWEILLLVPQVIFPASSRVPEV